MPPLFNLPLGQPDSALTEADRLQYLEDFRLALSLDPAAFSPSRPFRSFSFSTSFARINQFIRLYALWDGYAIVEGDQLLLEMAPSRYDQLQRADYREVPIPKFARYGPVINSPTNYGRAVRRGEYLGDLPAGEAFHCELLDAHDYYLDPQYFFAAWHEAGLWDLPRKAAFPYSAEADINGLLISGPSLLGPNDAYLRIEGGARPFTVLNPAAELDPIYFSFLSDDTIRIEAVNLTEPTQLRVEDVSDVMYRNTTPGEFTFDPSAVLDWEFTPQKNLKPKHKKYVRRKENEPGNGKRTPGEPLTYEVQVGTGATALTTTIRQDVKDVIRQEYLFHSKPFQESFTLPVPGRVEIKFNNNISSKHFSADQIQNSNYGNPTDNWVLNARESLLIAEYLRAIYHQLVEQGRLDSPEDFERVVSSDLTINSAWRNPERNEAVGGVQNSNHQFGKALDIKSIYRGEINYNADNIGAFMALFGTGRIFLEELLDHNLPKDLSRVEILLERSAEFNNGESGGILWQYKPRMNGEIDSFSGAAYRRGVGSQPADETEAIRKAARYATHVHFSWNSPDSTDPLALPTLEEEVVLPIGELPEKNIIVIGTEDDAVPAENQVALNYGAKSLAQFLQAFTPDTPTEIHEVDNAIDFLQLCNAFRTPTYRIKYFFSFTQAGMNNLTLKHYSGAPDPASLESQTFLEEINLLYGIPPEELVDEDLVPVSLPGIFSYGEDELIEIMPHQVRVANLTFLPQIYRQRMQTTFQESNGVFLIGCNETEGPSNRKSNFCRAFATVIQREVYGAYHPTFCFAPNENDKWAAVTVNRQTDADTLPGSAVVIVPGKYIRRTMQFYMRRHFRNMPPFLPSIPQLPDLISVYRKFLTRFVPKKKLVVR